MNKKLQRKKGWNKFKFPFKGFYSPIMFKDIAVLVTNKDKTKKYYFNELNIKDRLISLTKNDEFWLYSIKDFEYDIDSLANKKYQYNNDFEVYNRILENIKYSKQIKRNDKREGRIFAACRGIETPYLTAYEVNGMLDTFSNNSIEDITDTNSQEKGVSESDIVKHNGDIIVFKNSHNSISITKFKHLLKKHFKTKQNEISYKELKNNKRKEIFFDFSVNDIYLEKDNIIVIGKKDISLDNPTSIIEILDINTGRKKDNLTFKGKCISTRILNDNLYIVNEFYPYIEETITEDILYEDERKEKYVSKTEENFQTDINGISLLSKDKTYFDASFKDNFYFTSIIKYDLSTKEIDYKTITSNSNELYMNQNRIVFISTNSKETTLFVFDIDLNFIGDITLEGEIKNQFFISEKNGVIRLSTSIGDSFKNKTDNFLYTLEEKNNEIVIKDKYNGFGLPGEKIHGIRYIGDIAYIVTFKKTDPLYTFDLSNGNIKYLGELKIPGYSKYFHPIDNERLLSIGKDADENGNESGVILQLFDIRDLTNVKLVDKVKIGNDWYTYSSALDNHKKFIFRESDNLFGFDINNNNIFNIDFFDSNKKEKDDFYTYKVDEFKINFINKTKVNSNGKGLFLTYNNTDFILYIDFDTYYITSI